MSASQINFQVPWKVVDQLATINVTNGVWNLTLDQLGAFKLAWIVLDPILHSADYSLVTSENPAVDGEVVLIYATGLGPVSNTPGRWDASAGCAACGHKDPSTSMD